jgi:hypothetical protein
MRGIYEERSLLLLHGRNPLLEYQTKNTQIDNLTENKSKCGKCVEFLSLAWYVGQIGRRREEAWERMLSEICEKVRKCNFVT